MLKSKTMQAQEFRVVYDILQEGYGIAPFLLGFMAIGLAVALYFQLVSFFDSDIFEKELRDFAPIILLPIILIFLVFSSINTFQTRKECLDSAKNEEVSVTQGIVKNLVSNSKRESFSVNNRNFEYSKHNWEECGFNLNSQVTIYEGMYVKISFANGRILKLEVPK